jgi:hypothetical protein
VVLSARCGLMYSTKFSFPYLVMSSTNSPVNISSSTTPKL